ncbi:MAG TPA: tetratricopeptide repeat protein, partial [Candidatus Solibacter sp.]|nr:tetratricopeptide repeat protein [Candidatus Solibacter sp.]
AGVLTSETRLAEADQRLREAISIAATAMEEDDNEAIILYSQRANLFLLREDYAPAEPLCRRIVAMSEKAFGPENVEVARPLVLLAAVYSSLRKFSSAESASQRALAILEKQPDPDQLAIAGAWNNLTVVYTGTGDYGRAEHAFEEAIRLIEQRYGPTHPDLSTMLTNGADLYCKMSRFEQAKSLAERAWKLDEQTRGPKSLLVARDLRVYAAALRGMKQKSAARKHEAMAKSILQLHDAAGH